MLNESAKGVCGARGRREAETIEREKNLIVARALEEHQKRYATLQASPTTQKSQQKIMEEKSLLKKTASQGDEEESPENLGILKQYNSDADVSQ